MKMIKLISALILNIILVSVTHADNSKLLIGSWCFYEQTAAGNTVSEKVDITFNDNYTYIWKEGVFEQSGTWEVNKEKLIMSNVGTHQILTINGGEMELKRMSVMKYRKSKSRHPIKKLSQ
ncbi:MAG: hypothetical protein ABW157_06300 [Candidatus Thiodiazotropha sp. LLP2]